MKRSFINLFTVLILAVTVLESCGDEKGNEPQLVVPEVSTKTVTGISYTTAISGGSILFDGGTAITEVGICFSTNSNPTIDDNKVIGILNDDEFTNDMELEPSTTYFVRAYAINKIGVGYGNALQFNTSVLEAPTVSTITAGPATMTTIPVQGNVTSNGGSPILERGFCWSLQNTPTIDNDKVTVAAGLGTFDEVIEELIPNGKYYVRAFATNAVGTSYGNVLSATMQAPDAWNKYGGIYEVVSGSVIRNTDTGPDLTLSGPYIAGLTMGLFPVNANTVSIQPLWKDGTGVGGVNGTILFLNEATNQVTVSCSTNPTLTNTIGAENTFTIGLPSTAGTTAPQEFLLSFEWGIAPNTRIISNLRLRYKNPRP